MSRLEPPTWATIQQLADDEYCFRSKDWLVMGEGYPTSEEAVKGAWAHHEQVLVAQGEAGRQLSIIEDELADTRKQLLKTFTELMAAVYPNDPLPSMRDLAKKKWGEVVAANLFPVEAFSDEDED